MVIAIAGATGNLGQFITAACLATPFRGSFSEVRVLTRDSSTPIAQELQKAGASLSQVEYKPDSESLKKALKDVKILIDVQGSKGDGHQNQDLLLDLAAQSSSLKFYLPSEFGVETASLDFQQPEWSLKLKRQNRAREFGNFRVIGIYPGIFLEICFGPWMGFDVANQTFTAIGSADVPFSVTSKVDIGLSVASISSLLMKGASDHVPDHVKLSGSSLTINQVAKLFNQHGNLPKPTESKAQSPNLVKKIVQEILPNSSHQDIKVELIPLQPFKSKAIVTPGDLGLLDCLKFLIGEGKFNHSIDNCNQIVNPNDLWHFTTIEDYAQTVKGRPFCPETVPDLRSAIDQVKDKIQIRDLTHNHFTADIGQKQPQASDTVIDQTSLP